LTKISVIEVAEFLGGTIQGRQREWILGISKIDQGQEQTLSFLANPKYSEHLNTTLADVILIRRDQEIDGNSIKTFIQVDDPYLSFCQVLNTYFNPAVQKTGIDPSAVIDESAQIGDDSYIGPNVHIGSDVKIGDGAKIYPNCHVGDNVRIGNNALIYANVSIYHNCVIGDNVILHAGTVIGSDGFGHAPQKDGTYVKIPQVGNVVIGDDVEMGANCAIDRATIGSTKIGSGVKLDNLVQVAHNVEIGANTVIAAQSGIAGSTILGENCVLGGQVGIAGHLKIARGTQFGAQSGSGKDILEENTRHFGSPVMPLKDALRSHLLIRKLPDMREQLADLNKAVKELTDQINNKKNTKD